jgi:hypothetical protein
MTSIEILWGWTEFILNVVLILRKVCIFALKVTFVNYPGSILSGDCILILYYEQQ